MKWTWSTDCECYALTCSGVLKLCATFRLTFDFVVAGRFGRSSDNVILSLQERIRSMSSSTVC